MNGATPAHPAKRLIWLCLGLASFTACCYAMRVLTAPHRREFDSFTAAKLDEVGESDRPVDTLFFGSSRVFRHINPAAFDAATAESGHPTHSYNLAAPNTTWTEIEFLVRRVQADPELADCTFIVEPSFELGFHPDNATQARYTRYTNPGNAIDALAVAWIKPRPVVRRIQESLAVLLSATYNITNAGAVSDLVFPESPGTSDYTFVPGQQGHVPLDAEQGPRYDERHALFLDALAATHGNIPAILKTRSAGQAMDYEPGLARRIEALAKEVESRGGRLIVLNSLWVDNDLRQKLIDDYETGQTGFPVLYPAYDLAERPDDPLLDASYWYDHGHLSAAGAERYSRRVARAYLDLLEKGDAD